MLPASTKLKRVNISIGEIGRQVVFHAYDSADCISHAVLNHGCWESFQTLVGLRILSDGDSFKGNFIDVGANIGWHSTIAALAIDGHGAVYSFEPHPNNFKVLSRNITENAAKNTETIEAACSDFLGKSTLHIHTDENMGAHSLHEGRNRENAVDVRVVTLDNVFDGKELSRAPTILKIDVEGLEHKVIAGSTNLLEKIKENCAIIIEINVDSQNHSPNDVFSFLDVFEKMNLFPLAISPSRMKLFPIDFDYLKQRMAENMTAHGKFFGDFLFISPSLKEKVASLTADLVNGVTFGTS